MLNAREAIRLQEENDALREQVAALRREQGHTFDSAQAAALMRQWPLTGAETKLLLHLWSRRDKIATKESMLNALYSDRPYGDEPHQKILDVFICKIRKKIGKDLIENVWARGYRLSDRGIAVVGYALERDR